jgi:hypothetical protein
MIAPRPALVVRPELDPNATSADVQSAVDDSQADVFALRP